MRRMSIRYLILCSMLMVSVIGLAGCPPTATPSLAVTPADQAVGAGPGNTTFEVANESSGTMNWTAAVNPADTWLTVNPPSGTGAGTLTATYTANNTTSQRVGHITVTAPLATGSPVAVTVTQAGGVAPAITTQPVSQTVNAGVSISFTVAATGTAPLSYQWKKNDTNISGATLATYTIASAANANEGNYTCVVSNAVDSDTSDPATLVVETSPAASILIKGMSAEEVTAAGLTTTPSSGLDNVGEGTDVYLVAEASDADDDSLTYGWSLLSKPDGSTADFVTPNPVFEADAASTVVLHTDMVGSYEVQLSVSDVVTKSITNVTQKINAGDWVGVGLVAKDGSSITDSSCAWCHSNGGPAPDKLTLWLGTKHATYFPRALDGEISSRYGTSCYKCHTVGNDPSPTAVNNGFDDVMADLGWTFPSPLTDGNWDSFVTNYPSLARLSSIQCEHCHGPASEHLSNAFAADKKIDVSLTADACGQCHHQPVQWKTMGHSDAESMAFTYPVGPNRTACVKCHSGVGFIDFANGVPQAEQRTSKQVHSCGVCHDSHDDTNPAQLRVYNEVTLPGDAAPRTGMGESATCMTCHNGRVAPDVATAANPSFPHYSTASEALLGLNGITWGHRIPNSIHTQIADCVECHMAATPGNSHDTIHTPGEDEVGAHTFRVVFKKTGDPEDGFENVANSCNTANCHAYNPLTAIDRTAFGDYDGDGNVEGVQEEVQGLLALVKTQIVAKGVVALASHPYWSWTAVPAENLTLAKQAVWNYSLIQHEGSSGIHNVGYSVGLLQLTYKQLTGVDVPGASLRY